MSCMAIAYTTKESLHIKLLRSLTHGQLTTDALLTTGYYCADSVVSQLNKMRRVKWVQRHGENWSITRSGRHALAEQLQLAGALRGEFKSVRIISHAAMQRRKRVQGNASELRRYYRNKDRIKA